ncbi:glycoside hydrolase family 28 protein [Pedobacter insulae]|uniref:Polygalacturonase n=1 Tax=Pedobacter insulae TaxID=414048 RepID=A0A1I2ZYI9_9SPHI|nr:glycoside hydrolase family 28 protein [Pedobacter insulae]SFH42903.1 Polygalacturonase [Pedobacter insulae]
MNKIASILFTVALFSTSISLNAQTGVGKAYSFDNLPKVAKTSFKADTLNIIKYGAVGDGLTLNTKSINDAVIACNKRGGGVVLIPQGLWLTGPIELKSNVNLHLQKNSILQFTKDFNQYPLVASNWEGLPQMRNQSPLWATNQQNIAITGHGIIDGAGEAWRMVKKEKLTANQWSKLLASGGVLSEDKKTWYPTEKFFNAAKMKNPGEITPDKTPEFYQSIKDFLRPNLLVFTSCKRILLEGVTFQNSAAWNIHPLMCEDLTVRNVYAKNPWYAQNGDGIDIESCKNVLIEGSTFDVGDDGICIKSGRDAAGRKRGMPTENVIIRNSTVYQAHGGFVIGSEMSGGAKNIFVYDCSFIGTDIGLRFKTTRGRGGVVEKIFVKNINMIGIIGEAILFDMYYAAVDPVPLKGEKREAPKVVILPVTEETPTFKDFYISNVTCDGAAKAVFMRGLPELSISNINLANLSIKAKEGIDIQEAKNITLHNVSLTVDEANPLINIQNGNQINFNNLKYNTAQLLFRISGDRNSAIRTSGLDATKANVKTEFLAGAEEKSLQINK